MSIGAIFIISSQESTERGAAAIENRDEGIAPAISEERFPIDTLRSRPIPDEIMKRASIGTLISIGKDQLLVGLGKRKWHRSPPLTSQPVFYFPDFFLTTSHPWFTHAICLEMTLEALLTSSLKVLAETNSADSPPLHWENPYRSLFEETFCHLQKEFASGHLVKAVPFVFEETQSLMTEERLLNSLIALCRYANAQPLFLYGFWEQGEGILGATPERLFSFEKKESLMIETMALAATRGMESQGRELLKDLKQKREHDLVVEGIVASLVSLGRIHCGEVREIQLPQLAHLMTPITLETHCEISFTDLVQRLHPTPALGAFPKEPGRRWLLDYQTKIARHRFGAPVGYMRGERGHCYVAIRNVQWSDKGMRVGAGCGIIAESQREKEWQEIQVKLKTTRQSLAL